MKLNVFIKILNFTIILLIIFTYMIPIISGDLIHKNVISNNKETLISDNSNCDWAINAGGMEGGNYGRNIYVDSYENSFVTGHFKDITYFGDYNITSNGEEDIFVAKVDSYSNCNYNIISSNQDLSRLPENYIIENVPYVSQETNFFCAYACFTMLINNFKNINTTLQEVVYYTGIGYSLIYPSFLLDRNPLSSTLCSQASKDVDFLTSLFGLSRAAWNPDMDSIPEEHRWLEYWIRVKENISNNKPILTSVDPFKLSSFQSLVNLPDFLWNIMPPSGHGIILVGYNESNQTICYNDPASALFGYPEYGTYAWMNLTKFNEAILRTMGGQYAIVTFNQVSDPLTREDAFNKSHARNIERLRGNISVYDDYYISMSEGAEYGINGIKLFKKHLEPGNKNRIKTIFTYKSHEKIGIFYRLVKIFGPILTKILKLPSNSIEKFTINEFKRIAIEKTWVTKFLNENSDLSNSCEYEAMLFEREADYWYQLSSIYSIFQKKGYLLSWPRAIFITYRMNKSINKIIEIQEALINFDKLREM